MKCVEIQEHLETFLDGEISVILREKIELHLNSCKACRAEFVELRSVSDLLKKDLPVAAPNRLDTKILAAFHQHQQAKKKERWSWLTVFGTFLTPKIGFAALTFCILTGLAFLMGRITAPAPQPIIVSNPETIKESVPTETVKYIEIPITKYVEVPTEKEKIVTRTVYRNVENYRKSEAQNPRLVNVSSQNAEAVQQIDLKDFQPLGEISPKILKKGETNEK
ncbi:MAG TPA: zf-HC2 domain-containing protein [Pyrinomonadaceae bacterium]|nr:zf-HC2 domain-containing protein [Pyrinomonadaceae bacterium]